MARIRNPGVVPVYDADDINGRAPCDNPVCGLSRVYRFSRKDKDYHEVTVTTHATWALNLCYLCCDCADYTYACAASGAAVA